MKKDIEWMKEIISIERKLLSESLVGAQETEVERIFNDGKEHGLIFASNIIDQLDELEVLSQEWISENVEYAYFDMLDGSGRLSSATAIIKPKKLQNLLVPKQELPVEKLETLSQAWIDENHFETENWDEDLFKSDGESIAHTPHIKVIAVQDLEKQLVPKQEEVDRASKDGYEEGKQHGFYKGYREGLADKGGEPETVADVITDFYKSLERMEKVLSMEVEELEESNHH